MLTEEKSRYWSRAAKAAVPYTPGEQPRNRKFIKLNTNENPYGPSPKLKCLSAAELPMQLYPDPSGLSLRKAIGELNGLSPEEVFLGNGSDEVLAFAFGAFGDEERPFAFPDITYSFYPVWSDFYRVHPQVFPLGKDLSIDLSLVPAGEGPLVIANPNAPIGIALPARVLRDFLNNHPERLLILDEAYVDFGAESMVPYIRDYPNLLVIQTFSKSQALAGIRLGFAMGQASLIEAMNRIKDSFNSYTVSRYTQAAGEISYRDTDYFKETVGKIVSTRERVKKALHDLGFELTDSMTNFLWVKHPILSGDTLYQALRDRGILVRHFSDPRLRDYLRITVGTDEEMDTLLQALKQIEDTIL